MVHDNNNNRWGRWGVWLLGLGFLYVLFLSWVALLPLWLDTITHTGLFDPTTIKWLLLGGLVYFVILLLVAVWANWDGKKGRVRPVGTMWILFAASYLLLVLSIFALIWDDTDADVFTGGVPVQPEAMDIDFVAKMDALRAWEHILEATLFSSFLILMAMIIGYAMRIMAVAVVARAITRAAGKPNGTGARASQKMSRPAPKRGRGEEEELFEW